MKTSEKQDQDTDLLMSELDEEIKEEDLIGDVGEDLLSLNARDETSQIDN